MLGTNDNKDVHKLRKQFRNLVYLISKYPNNSYIRGRIQIARKKLCKANKQQDRETKNKKLFEKLENLHDEDPTTYWNIISGLTEKNTTKNTIPDSMIEKLKSHFENLGRPHPDTMHWKPPVWMGAAWEWNKLKWNAWFSDHRKRNKTCHQIAQIE